MTISVWGAAAAAVTRTGQATCYDGLGNVDECEGTGQDGDVQAGAAWPEPRFIDNGDGTVTDYLTGLMWLKDGGCLGEISWLAARKKAADFNNNPEKYKCTAYKAAYKDWTLPGIGQLESLINAEEDDSAAWLNKNGFSGLRPQPYWSATVFVNPYNAWLAGLGGGQVTYAGKIDHHRALLVRVAGPASSREPAEQRPAARFIDNGDGTVADPGTGLMWLKDGGCLAESDWPEALAAVGDFNSAPAAFACLDYAAAFNDWRLPSRNELRSLIDHSRDFPALPAGHPFTNIEAGYWSSSTMAAEPGSAAAIRPDSGEMRGQAKTERYFTWPVRFITPPPVQPKVAGKAELRLGRTKSYILREGRDSQGDIDWPRPRFTDNGDGTATDNLTGLMWLKDGDCFGKRRWRAAVYVVDDFNRRPFRYNCAEYKARYNDWHLPDINELGTLFGKQGIDYAGWLNSQGVANVQPLNYWSTTLSIYNLYHATAVSIKHGRARNYAKTLEFSVWPVRPSQVVAGPAPQPEIRANDSAAPVALTAGDPLLLTVALANAGVNAPADFWVWYETPEGTFWLSGRRTWEAEPTTVYAGNLFELGTYQLFSANTSKLLPGEYSFHFSVDLEPDGRPGDDRYDASVTVVVE